MIPGSEKTSGALPLPNIKNNNTSNPVVILEDNKKLSIIGGNKFTQMEFKFKQIKYK